MAKKKKLKEGSPAEERGESAKEERAEQASGMEHDGTFDAAKHAATRTKKKKVY